MKGHPSLASRPELRSRKDLHHVVPISTHGDGVTYAKTMRAGNESMEVLSWTSMLSSHATLLSSYLIICLVKSVIKTVYFGNTWQAVWKIIIWSLNALSSGLWPSQDWQGRQWPAQSRDAKRAGTQLAGGYAATLWNIRADLDFLALHFGLRHYSSSQPCKAWQERQQTHLKAHRKNALWRASAKVACQGWGGENHVVWCECFLPEFGF